MIFGDTNMNMIKGKVWVHSARQDEEQNKFGETVKIVVTDPEDTEKILFECGPYTVPTGGAVTHEKLTGIFAF